MIACQQKDLSLCFPAQVRIMVSEMAKRKNEAAAALAKLRAKKLSPERRQEIAKTAGEARMERITPKRRAEIARKAAAARWAGHEAKRPASKRAPKSE